MLARCILCFTASIFVAMVQPAWTRALSKEIPEGPISQAPPSYKVNVVREIDHVGAPFTQGLEISADGKHLVETSGSYPPGTDSFIRLVDPADGKTVHSLKDGLDSRFAEGIVQASNGHFFMSTYENRKALEYDQDLKFIGEHDYPEMGWGLTRSPTGSSFLATNGTEFLMTLEANTFKLLEAKPVMCMGRSVTGLNELEMVDNFMGKGPTLLGNVYGSRLVLAVNPKTAHCTGVFSLEGLGVTEANEGSGFHVANGLAYNKTSNTLYVTGKNWDKMYEVSLSVDTTDIAAAVPGLKSFVKSHPGGSKTVLLQINPGGDSAEPNKKQSTKNILMRS